MVSACGTITILKHDPVAVRFKPQALDVVVIALTTCPHTPNTPEHKMMTQQDNPDHNGLYHHA